MKDLIQILTQCTLRRSATVRDQDEDIKIVRSVHKINAARR